MARGCVDIETAASADDVRVEFGAVVEEVLLGFALEFSLIGVLV